jgi:integrase
MPILLDWPLNTTPPYRTAVASEIRAVLTLFPDYFDGYPATATHRQQLADTATFLESSTDSSQITDVTGRHRLVSSAKNHPVYTCLDPDTDFVSCAAGDGASADDQQLERIGRLLNLLHICGAHPLPHGVVSNIALFCRNLPLALSSQNLRPLPPTLDNEAPNRYFEIQVISAEFIKLRDWSGLEQLIKSVKNNFFTKNSARIHELIMICQELTAIEKRRKRPEVTRLKTTALLDTQGLSAAFEQVLVTPAGPIKDQTEEDDPNYEPDEQNEIPLPSDDPDDGTAYQSSSIIRVRESSRTTDLPESGLERVSVRGSQLRFHSIWSGISTETLIAAEARSCMAFFMNYHSGSDAEEITRLLFILSGTFGHKFNNILVGFQPPFQFDDPVPKLHLQRSASHVTLTFSVLGNRAFAKLKPEQIKDSCFDPVSQELKLRVDLSKLTERPHVLDLICEINSISHPLLEEILEAKKKLISTVQSTITNRFTALRWRGALTQAVITHTTDIPFAQLLLAEDYGINASSLHYIAWDREWIETTLAKASRNIFGEYAVNARVVTETALIGAPNGGLQINTVKMVSKTLQDGLSQQHNDSDILNISYHNNLVDWVAWLLMLTTASRNNADFGELSLNQISFSASVLIYKDKPADPSIFRRLAAIPQFVIAEICRLVHHLIKLRDYLRRFQGNKAERLLHQQVNNSLKGDAPLLFHITTQERRPREKAAPLNTFCATPWKARSFINHYFGISHRLNLCRSLFSTQVRLHNLLPGLLIETQLGHIMGKSLFADDSVIAVTEFSAAMEEPLHQYLSICGVNRNKSYSTPKTAAFLKTEIKPISAILHGISQEKKEDKQRIRALRGLDPNSQEALNCTTAIETSLRDFLNLPPDTPLPRKGELTQSQCIELSKTILSKVPGNERVLVSALAQFRSKLRKLEADFEWEIDIPPPVFWHIGTPMSLTQYHLQAYEQVLQFRRDVVKSIVSAKTELTSYAAALYLVSFGFVSNFETAKRIFIQRRIPTSLSAANAWAIDIDIDDEHRMGRVFTKPAILAINAVFNSNHQTLPESDFYRNIHNLLPREWRSDGRSYRTRLVELEKLFKLARKIEAPRLLADAFDGDLLQRELTAKRSGELHNNTGCNTVLPNTVSDKTPSFATISSNTPIKRGQLSRDLAIFKSILPSTVKQGNRPWRAVRSNLNDYLAKHIHPTMKLIVMWTQRLLESDANFKTKGVLSKKAVRDYVIDVATILLLSLGDADITQLDDEEIYDLINGILNDKTKANIRKKSPDHMNRFFFEMNKKSDLPRLRFVSESQTVEGIDAQVITQKEHELAIKQISAWSDSGQLSHAARMGLKEVIQYSHLQRTYGTRRSELLFLRPKDVIFNSQLIIIRHHQDRSLKTAAAKRLLSASTSQWENLKLSLDSNAQYVFPMMHKKGLEIHAADAATHALKIATGNPNTRLHHQRHSVATLNVANLFEEKDILKRWMTAARLATEIGHANIRTTATHYAHCVQLPYAKHYTPSLGEINGSIIQRFQKVSNITNFIKSKNFKRFESQLSTRPIRSSIYTKDIKNNLPNFFSLRETNASDIITMCSLMFQGKTGHRQSQEVVDTSTQTKFIKTLRDIQHIANYEAFSNDYLHAKLVDQTTPIEHVTRRHIAQHLFSNWKDAVKYKSTEYLAKNADKLLAYSNGIRWQGRPVAWHCRPGDRDEIIQLLSEIGLPITCVRSEEFENRLTLKISGNNAQQEISTTSIRCLLIIALSISCLKSPT